MQMLSVMLAQAAPAGVGGGQVQMLVMMALLFAIFYFIMIRPQQRKEKERQKMIAELRVGQRVIFAGGLVGTIAESRQYTFLIEISNGVRIEVARGAVSRVLKEGESAALEQHA